uniref:Uncharacterized protein n=1 Tax=Rhipicephalus zambeziensis TaxID=60191 RepID=A0A224Z024_9ACAR
MDPATVTTGTAAHSANPAQGSSGASAGNGAEHVRILTELSRLLHRVSSLNSGFSPPASPSSAVWAVPVLRGFQDDVFLWVETINSLGSLLAWPECRKWLTAIDHLRDAAKAWHAYEGVRQGSWSEWCAKLTSLFRPLSHACDPLTTDRASTTHLDGAARASSNLPSLGDGAREVQRPIGAAVPGSYSTDSFPEGPAAVIDTSRKVYSSLQVSDSASIPATQFPLTEFITVSTPQQPASRPPSWSALECLDASAFCVTTSALSLPGGDEAQATTAGLAHNQEPHHPRPSAQSLAECANARHLPSAVCLKESQVPIAPEDDVIDDLPVQLTVAPDDKAFGQVGSIERDTLARTITSSTCTTSAMPQEHDLPHKSPCELCPAMSQMSSGTTRRTLTRPEQRRRLRSVRAVSVLHSGFSAMYFQLRRGSLHDNRQRPPRHSQCRPPEYLAVQQDSKQDAAASHHGRDHVPQSVRARTHRYLLGVRRPLRHTQCRPPETLLPHLQTKLQRAWNRPLS